jgi:DNA-3-methyladenine glycosylase
MHHCLNVVTSVDGDPQAVLLRAAEPLDGWAARLSGPALLADGFGIERADDGADLLGPHLWMEGGTPPRRVVSDRRIGVAYAGTWAARRLRFLDQDSAAVSQPPSAARRTGTPAVAKAVSGKRRAFKQDRGRSRDG